MAVRTRLGQRTYWHLLEQRRVPSRYAVATSRLLWQATHGPSVSTPVTAWAEPYQAARSPLRADDWELFADPRETTYAAYTELRAEREAHVGAVLRAAALVDGELDGAWAAQVDAALTTLRYPRHALMMVAAYAGSMAPSGRLTVALALQSADETRHVHRLRERLACLHRVRGSQPPAQPKERWLGDADWQPLRRVTEELLVAYDFGESLIVLNHVLKPRLDAAMAELGARAGRAGDMVTRDVLRSLGEDAAWHVEWTQALLDLILDQHDNRATVERWSTAWSPRVDEAIARLRGPLGLEPLA